jgi:hypothetical protein
MIVLHLPRPLRLIAALCAMSLAAGCASSAPSPATSAVAAPEVREEAPTRLEPRAWTAESDAGEIAAWARAGCRRPAEGKDACIERALVALLADVGVARTMEVLDSLAAADAEIFPDGHALAHGLGISAYRSPETMAATFAACPATQMSGCGHGVIQGYFLDVGRQGRPIGTAEMDALCEPHRAALFVYFHCAHGMGHGLMAVHANHLPTALAGCDAASDWFVRETCYGGAFMENIVQVTHPHHTAGGHAGTQGGGDDGHAGHAAGGHGGHAGDGHAVAQGMDHGAWKALDAAEPLYPCTVLDRRYLDACYANQTSAIMFFNAGDVAATARACAAAPPEFTGTCFHSLGRDVTAWTAQDHGRSIELCRVAGEAAGERPGTWCALGALGTLINQSADPQDGMPFCRALPGADAKRECYRVVGESVGRMVTGTQARGRHCETAEPEFVVVCRRGAGIEPSGVREE